MSCDHVQQQISSLIDRRIADAEEENVRAHIESCNACQERWESALSLRSALRGMAQPEVPAPLAAKLRVLASHERERQLSRVSLSARLRHLTARAGLYFDNLMRPVALPFAGGVLSALLSFGLLVPTLSFPHNFVGGPTFFVEPAGSTVDLSGQTSDSINILAPRIQPVDSPYTGYTNVVDLTIDENGKVVDWTVVSGRLTEELNNLIILSRFIPATTFGLPTSGKIRAVQGPIIVGPSYSFTVRS
ncbi:MAG: zf-HC2 domain-containing protein [Acidobacteriia bacterium]|nr:zf-HC2 domain-containing protein [Terriglobia bacterium]